MKQFFTRLLMMLAGLTFFALGIVLAIRADIGYAPWEVFHVGLAYTTGLSIGIVSIIVGVVIVALVVLLKEKLGLATILNMLWVGLFIDIFFPHIPLSKNPVIGTIMLLAGIICIAVGSCFYMKSAFGAGPRDSLMIALARKTKLPVGLCRGAIELLVTIAGWFLGGMVGFGTILFVVLIGLCIQTVFKLFKFNATAVKHETLRDTYLALKTIMNQQNRNKSG